MWGGRSDSWGDGNSKVGEMMDPPDSHRLQIRRWSENRFLRDKRSHIWARHMNSDRGARRKDRLTPRPELRQWNAAWPAPTDTVVRQRPASADSMAASSSKAPPPAREEFEEELPEAEVEEELPAGGEAPIHDDQNQRFDIWNLLADQAAN